MAENSMSRVCAAAALFFGATLLHGAASCAEAVAEPNAEAAITYNYAANELSAPGVTGYDLNIATVTAGAQINLPIWRLIGASFSGEGGRTTYDVDVAGSDYFPPISFSCTASQWGAGTTLFARDPELGRVRAGYRTGRLPTCGVSSSTGEFDDATTVGSYGVDAEYYLHRWTVGATYSRETSADFDQRSGVNRYGMNLFFYPIDQLRIGGAYSRTANSVDEKRYGASIEYQPVALGNRVSAGLRYDRGTVGFLDASVYRLMVTYLFAAQPELGRRDRYYR